MDLHLQVMVCSYIIMYIYMYVYMYVYIYIHELFMYLMFFFKHLLTLDSNRQITTDLEGAINPPTAHVQGETMAS